MPVARIRTYDNWSQVHAGMRVSKDEMAGSELQMHRQSRDFILPRHDVGFDDSRMLLEGELKKVSYRWILHRHIDTLLRGLNETELALVRIETLSGIPDAPVTLGIVKVWIDFVARKSSYPQMLDLHMRIGRRWIEISKVGIIYGFDWQGGIVV